MSLRPPISSIRVALCLAALVTAAGAGAQTTLTLNVNNGTAVAVAKDDCTRTLTVNWALSGTGQSGCSGDHADLQL